MRTSLSLFLLMTLATVAEAKEYRHGSGIGFTYPSTWTVSESTGVLVLTPPRVAKSPQGQAIEGYLVGTQAAPGIATPADPQVLAYLDQTARSLSPLLARQGQPTVIAMPRGRGFSGDQGIQIEYEAATPDGQTVKARMYACILSGQGVVLAGFGVGNLVAGRHRDLLAMFLSINQKDGAAAAGPAAGELGNDAWGFFFRPPTGWSHRASAQGALLGHGQIAGMIMVRPHQEKGQAAVRAQLLKGLQEAQITLRLVGRLRTAGKHGLVGDYTGTLQGNAVKARIIGTASPHGSGGAWIFAVSTPEGFTDALGKAAEDLGRTLRYVKLEVSSVMRSLAGTWSGGTSNTTSRHTFAADGRYYGASESSYGGRFHNSQGDWTGSWGAGGASRAAGRWVARGTREQGTITITMNDGSTRTITYRVQREKGRTYWNEYWFNGRLHGKR